MSVNNCENCWIMLKMFRFPNQQVNQWSMPMTNLVLCSIFFLNFNSLWTETSIIQFHILIINWTKVWHKKLMVLEVFFCEITEIWKIKRIYFAIKFQSLIFLFFKFSGFCWSASWTNHHWEVFKMSDPLLSSNQVFYPPPALDNWLFRNDVTLIWPLHYTLYKNGWWPS